MVVLMEAFGVNEHIRDVCRRFADLGHFAIAPDLYHRAGRYVTGPYDDPSVVMGYFAELTTSKMSDDITATMDAVVSEYGIEHERTAVIGFCLGGYGAVLAATRSEPAIVAGFYGAGLCIPRESSPLDPLSTEFNRIECPVFLFYGADDPVIPRAEVEQTREALAAAGVSATVEVYVGAGHGFFCDERLSYSAEAADDAWHRVTAAFGELDQRS